jgi:hypothetical protein
MPVDTDAVRRARAESDVIMGEIMKKPVSLDTALQERAGEIVHQERLLPGLIE